MHARRIAPFPRFAVLPWNYVSFWACVKIKGKALRQACHLPPFLIPLNGTVFQQFQLCGLPYCCMIIFLVHSLFCSRYREIVLSEVGCQLDLCDSLAFSILLPRIEGINMLTTRLRILQLEYLAFFSNFMQNRCEYFMARYHLGQAEVSESTLSLNCWRSPFHNIRGMICI